MKKHNIELLEKLTEEEIDRVKELMEHAAFKDHPEMLERREMTIAWYRRILKQFKESDYEMDLDRVMEDK